MRSEEAHWHTWHLQSLGAFASLGFSFLTYEMEIMHVLPLQGGADNHEKTKSGATRCSLNKGWLLIITSSITMTHVVSTPPPQAAWFKCSCSLLPAL